jgi:hypothetical protein
VGFDTSWNPFDQSLNTTDGVQFSQLQVGPSPGQFATVSTTNFTVLDFTPPGAPVIQSQLGASGLSLNQAGAGITFPNSTTQTTAFIPADYAAIASTNTFTASQVIETTSTTAALRVTQLGTGEAFRVEDSANPDTSPFVITAAGECGIGGVPFGGFKLRIDGGTQAFGSLQSTIGSGSSVCFVGQHNGTGSVATFTNTATATADAVRITNLGSGNSFVVEDSTNPDASPFVINADGNIGIGRQPTSRKVEMTGNLAVTGQTNLATSSGNINVLLVESHASNTADCVLINHAGTGASFRVNDQAADTTPFIVDAGGNVGVKTASPSTDFEVNGNAKATTVTIGSSAALTGIATDAQAVAGTSTTLATSVKAASLANLVNVWSPNVSAMSTASSGAGVNIGSTISALNGRLLGPNALTAGYGTRGFTTFYNSTTANVDTNYSGFFAIGANIYSGNWAGNNQIARFIWGRRNSTLPVPTYTVAEKSFGFEIEYTATGGVVRVFGHNGTTLSTATATFTPTNFRTFQAIATNDNGTVTLYINGTQEAQTTGGPTGTDDVYSWGQFEIVQEATAAAQKDFYFANPKFIIPAS